MVFAQEVIIKWEHKSDFVPFNFDLVIQQSKLSSSSMNLSGFFPDSHWISLWLIHSIDLGLVIALVYLLLLFIGDRRSFAMVRGLILVMLITVLSKYLRLPLLSFILEKLILGSVIAMAVIFQSELRLFLEQIGRGKINKLFERKHSQAKPDNVIDFIVDAVKELSQNRTGALIVLETIGTMDERMFVNPGVKLDAEVSKELIQSIFQTKTLLHDGAIFIRGSRIISASVILPLSERSASRQLGTRHRAAMGITEKIENCICIVVSEETGSISLGERGILNRPLTSSKLKELLQEKFSASVEQNVVPADLGLGSFSRKVSFEGLTLLKNLLRFRSKISKSKK